MSVDITARNGDFSDVTNVGWRLALEFARRCAWQPLGTEAPDGYDEDIAWDSSYDPAMGQSISAADAAAFGKAILNGLRSADRDAVVAAASTALNESAERLGYGATPPASVVNAKTIDMLQQVGDLAVGSGGFQIE